MRERERESVCVCFRKRGKECVCVCTTKRERESVCVYEEKEGERETNQKLFPIFIQQYVLQSLLDVHTLF